MANFVAGYVSDLDVEIDSVIGVEFDETHNRAVAYVNEEEISLTCKQVQQLERMCAQVVSQMQWFGATWVYAIDEGVPLGAQHLMKKGEHDIYGKTLCGKRPSDFARALGGFTLAPVLGSPSRAERGRFSGGVCRRCLAAYDRVVKKG